MVKVLPTEVAGPSQAMPSTVGDHTRLRSDEGQSQ